MKVYGTLRQTTLGCKYHAIFIPKCPRKVVCGQLRQELGSFSWAACREAVIHSAT